jgi:lauroyl/myristoyl acyltransferase
LSDAPTAFPARFALPPPPTPAASLGPDVSRECIEQFGRGVVENFYDFVCDVGQSLHLTRAQLLARIDSVEGHDHYEAARALKKGAIIATAHMGSFEAGAASIVRSRTGGARRLQAR